MSDIKWHLEKLKALINADVRVTQCDLDGYRHLCKHLINMYLGLDII